MTERMYMVAVHYTDDVSFDEPTLVRHSLAAHGDLEEPSFHAELHLLLDDNLRELRKFQAGLA